MSPDNEHKSEINGMRASSFNACQINTLTDGDATSFFLFVFVLGLTLIFHEAPCRFVPSETQLENRKKKKRNRKAMFPKYPI